jgi:general secretion pathway protein K
MKAGLNLSHERGIALFLVLWVMALLTVIAGEFCHAIRMEVNITRNFKEETEAHYIAAAGVFWAVGRLVIADGTPAPDRAVEMDAEAADPWRRIHGAMPPVSFGNGRFEVVKENESGKVNLNRAGRPLLEMMLNGFDLDETDKKIIVDSILDWRDRDNWRRADGAESDYYSALPRPYFSKNGDFTTVEELLLVRGVTPEIFYGGLAEMVSVFGDRATPAENRAQRRAEPDFNRININAASPRMVRSLPGMTEAAAAEIMAFRKEKDFLSLPQVFALIGPDVYPAISAYITLKPSPFYTIQSTGTVADGGTRQGVRAVVKIDRQQARGYTVLQWIDYLEYRS